MAFPELTALLKGELQETLVQQVLGRELQMAKDNIIGRLGIGLETSDRWAGFLGTQELLERKIEMPEDIAEAVKKVKGEEVQKVAEDLFKAKQLHLALLGPFPEGAEEKYLHFLAL